MHIGFLLTLCLLVVSASVSAQAPLSLSDESLRAPHATSVVRTASWSPGSRLDPHLYERERLLHARPSLFWPISTLSVSGAVAVGPWLLLGVLAGGAKLINPHGDGGHESRAQFRQDFWPLYIYSGVASVVFLGSVFWLRSAVQKRRTYNQQLKALYLTQAPYLLRW